MLSVQWFQHHCQHRLVNVKTLSSLALAQRADINQMCKNAGSCKMPENDGLIIYDGKLSPDDDNYPDSTQDNANTCLK